jgi:mannosyltransferase
MIQTMVDRFRSRQLERYFPITLVFVALGAMLISLMIGLHQSVWFDEAYSILLSKHSAVELVHLTSLDTHPPLYYLLLKGWAGIFGWSELALRSLSVIAMGGAVVFGGLLARRMFGVRMAIMALPFIALSPLLLRYGFEIRMYSLASLIGIAATYVLILATEAKTPSKQWKLYVIYAFLVALGVYTLYYTVLLWLAHFAWLTYRAYRDKKPIVKTPWFVAMLGSVALFLPWVPVFVSQAGNGALAAVSQAMTVDSLVGIGSFSFLYQPAWQLSGYGTIIIVFIAVIVSLALSQAFKKASKKERDYLLLLALYIMVPIVIITLVSLIRPMYTERYLSHVLIGGMLLVGIAIAYAMKKASRRMALAVALVYIVLILGVGQLAKVGNFNFQRLQKPNVKEVAALIKNECDHNTTVLASGPYVAIELSYYLPSCEIRFYSSSEVLRGGYAGLSNSPLRIAHPSTQLANSLRLLYVYYGKPQLIMPSNLIATSHEDYGPLNVDTFSAQ